VRSYKRSGAIVAVVACLVGAGCVVVPAQASPGPSAFTDREIVEGVVFASGPVATSLGLDDRGLDDLPEDVSSQVSQLSDELQAQMWASDDQVLDDAIDGLTSGDPYQVRDAQIVLGKSFADALGVVEPELVTGLDAAPLCGLVAPCITFAILASVAGVALAIVAETVIAAHANVATKTNVTWGRSQPVEGELPAVDATAFTAKLTEGLARR